MTEAAPSTLTTHPAFELVRQQTINTLKVTAFEYRHKKTGASHFHLASDYKENVFLVALRTMPMDNTGVAHILEHTALCGSQRFPVRDPFFMMIRRSLNTFMNAFTSSDWTAYPFASQNRKDFFNLLDVYLDATFFSRLDPLDFAQEGHRLEFSEKENPESALQFKGIVFNEMKGAMSSITSQLWQHMSSNLFPSNTYHFNSGGDPAFITDLTHQQLLDFYSDHYHPSNAIFMTFGDIPAAELQQQFEEKALKHFERSDFIKSVPREKPLPAPRIVEEFYACNDEDLADKTHHVMGWLLGESTSLEQLLKAQLLSAVLMDNSACPVMNLLETTKLGKSPSPLCGLEDSHRELVLVCGIEGSNPAQAAEFEMQLLKVLEDVADNGVDQSLVEAMMHQLELHQREVSGDGYPYGLQLILQSLPGAVHHQDPLALLDIDEQLNQLNQQIKQPGFIQSLVRELLLENRHRVRLSLKPDSGLADAMEAIEQQKLAEIEKTLDNDSKQQIIEQSKALEKRQQQIDDVSILPKVTIEDVPGEIRDLKPQQLFAGKTPVNYFARGTNGLAYQQLIIPLPELDETELSLIPLYCNALTETGIGEMDYIETQALQARYCGSLGAFTQIRSAIDSEQQTSGYIVLSGKALANNAEKLDELVYNTLTTVRFDEPERLRELMQQQLSRREQSISGNGHALAMAAAAAELSPQAWLNHAVSGLAGIESLRQRVKACETDQGIEDYCKQLQNLHSKLLKQQRQLLLISEEGSTLEYLEKHWSDAPANCAALDLPKKRNNRKEAWRCAVQVNYCAMAFPTVAVDHPDAAALTVLGGFLRNGYLHRVIREQGGAYGGGASQDNNLACFKFYSYRDPQLENTLQAFSDSIDWMLNTEHDPQQLEEAILGVISSLDKPGSPAGEAKKDFYNQLFGRSYEQRLRFRKRVLATTLDDLKRVTLEYLKDKENSQAVISHSGENQTLEKLAQQGFSVREL